MLLDVTRPGLASDPVAWVTGVLAILLALPLVAPLWPAIDLALYAELATTTPFLLLAGALYLRRLREADGEERRFWALLAAAVGCWLAQQALLAATWTSPLAHWSSVVQDVLYAATYLFVVLALDVQVHVGKTADDRGLLTALRRAGTVVFVFGLLVYFVFLPSVLAPATYWTVFPSLAFYLVLDGYLVLRLVHVLTRPLARRHRLVYSALLATASLWLALDSIETLLWAEWLPWVVPGGPWDLPWMLPPMALVAVGRLGRRSREDEEPASLAAVRAEAREPVSGGPLVVSVLFVPLLHIAAYARGLFGEATRQAHETTVLALVTVLGGLLYAYQRVLENRARRLEAERADALARIEHQALHDPLTGLPNRRLLSDRLEHAIAQAARRGELLGVLFFDLDEFKKINDSRGHAFGDRLLQHIGDRLAHQVRSSDTVARFGGDEFVVLTAQIESREAAARLAEKVLAALREPFHLDGAEVAVDASVGIALYPDDGADETTLLQRSDAAMYGFKERRRGAATRRAPPDGALDP